MKYRFFLLAAAFLCAPSLFALIPGDTVTPNPDCKLSWSNCSPMPLGALTQQEKQKLPPFRAVVFFRPRATDASRTLVMLDQLHKQNSAMLLIALIAPDPLSDVKQIQSANPDCRLRMAADTERKITGQFMAGTLFFPMAFLMDEQGVILWSGEAVDLPEAFLSAKNGTLDRDLQRKLAPMIADLLQQLRTGDDAAVYPAARRIFALDPGNATTLRIVLFLLENKGHFTEAKAMVMQQIRQAPTRMRLYFTVLDLMRRHPALRQDLPALADLFFEHASRPDEVIDFSRCLLNFFPDDPAALAAAAKLLNAVGTDLPPSLQPHFFAVRALLAYRLCDLPAALSCQQQALDAFRKLNRPEAAAEAEKQLHYYNDLQTLQTKNFPTK